MRADIGTPWDHVRGLERFSFCDWPGRNACVLFLGGCSLRCPTCHNAELAWAPELLPVLPREAVLAFLKARKKWLDGVVISGGEPTLAPGLPLLLAELRELGFACKLDTNGMQPDVVESLLEDGLVDLFAVDVKGPWRLYPALTGGCVTPQQAETGLSRIFQMASAAPHAFHFRTTPVPLLTPEDIAEAWACVPSGLSLTMQTYREPRRTYDATVYSKTGRQAGDLGGRPHRTSHSQSPQRLRHQGSDTFQTAVA